MAHELAGCEDDHEGQRKCSSSEGWHFYVGERMVRTLKQIIYYDK